MPLPALLSPQRQTQLKEDTYTHCYLIWLLLLLLLLLLRCPCIQAVDMCGRPRGSFCEKKHSRQSADENKQSIRNFSAVASAP